MRRETQRPNALQGDTASSPSSEAPSDSGHQPASWDAACVHEECTLHQLSPYIGKLKSTIARDLIEKYTKPGDLILDPFAGSFTVPLEALLLGRRAIGADISAYAFVLGSAKLCPPSSMEDATSRATTMLAECSRRKDPDLRHVPPWVRAFFHPRTLKEAIRFADFCLEKREYFLLACLLGILHHQRVGFLSYPSSHLVPYLRDKKFPRGRFPELYEYRPLEPRLIKKIERVYKRFQGFRAVGGQAVHAAIDGFNFPDGISCVITSPPYMNALDYGRDNRLRLWFLDRTPVKQIDTAGTKRKEGFEALMTRLARGVSASLVEGGHCVIIVGEQSNRGYRGSPSGTVCAVFEREAPGLRLVHTMCDDIPDIRRARRDCRGVRTEHFLVFRKVPNA